MKKITPWDRLRYQFDNSMSKGPIALIGWLFLASVILIAVISLIVVATRIDTEGRGFFEIAWMGLMRTLDAGTMGGDTGSWPFLFAMLAVTIGGVFVVSTLIGVLTASVEGKLEELQKGRSIVIERGHTVILGWSPQVFTIVSELVTANANQRSSCIAVLADQDKVEMEDQIRERAGKTGRTHIADVADDVADAAVAQLTGYRNLSVSFRQGDTTDRATLDGLEAATYQHMIVQSYADTLGPQEADARTLVTLLHLRDMADHCGHPFSIVSEMLDVRNRELAAVTRADDFIVSDELISLMLAQISENKELVPVFQDLFDPEGSELYLKPASDYVELGRAVNFYTVVESARQRGDVAIGFKLQSAAHDAEQSFGVKLNPRKSQMITFSEEDKVIALAES